MRPTHLKTPSTAAAVLLVGLVLLVQLPAVWAAAPYVGVLDLLCGVLAPVTAWRMWRGGRLEARLVAVVVVGLALAGQLLATSLGLPGASSLHGFHAWDAAATAVEVAAGVLLGRDLVAKPAQPGTTADIPEQRRALPYARAHGSPGARGGGRRRHRRSAGAHPGP